MERASARWILFLLIIALADIIIVLSTLIVNTFLCFLLLMVSIYHTGILEVLIKISSHIGQKGHIPDGMCPFCF